ncbi:hypothetical protein IJ541_08030 [bacterium]|nr:hypothetical protein [bacterium]
MLDTENNLMPEIETQPSTSVHREEDKFFIEGKTGLKLYVVKNDEPHHESTIYLNADYNKTSPANYQLCKTQQETVSARVLYIKDGKVGIEVFLPKGKVQKVLKNTYVNILKRKNLLSVGTEFDIQYTVDEDSTTTKILTQKYKADEEIEAIYNTLLEK